MGLGVAGRIGSAIVQYNRLKEGTGMGGDLLGGDGIVFVLCLSNLSRGCGRTEKQAARRGSAEDGWRWRNESVLLTIRGGLTLIFLTIN